MPQPDPLAQLASEALANSPALQHRVADFVDDVLDIATDILTNGTPKMQADIVGKLVPHLVRQLADKAEDDQIRSMREEFENMRRANRDSIGGTVVDVESDVKEGKSDIEVARINKIMDVLNSDIPTDTSPAKVIQITGGSKS